MPQPFRYRIKPGDSWSAIAKMFQTGVSQLLGYNPGVSQLSSGMQIKVPATNQYMAGGISPIRNMFIPSGPDPLGAALPTMAARTPYVNTGAGGKPTGNEFGVEYGRNRELPERPPAPTFTPIPREQNADPYASIKYERDAAGNPIYKYVPLFQNGRPVLNASGQQVTTPASIYTRDVMTEARRAGVSVSEYTTALQENGYTLFGGMWVYVGTGDAAAGGGSGAAPERAFYRVGAGRDKWVTTEQAQTSAGRRRGSAYQERMEYRNEQERRKKKNNNNDQGATNVNFGVGAG